MAEAGSGRSKEPRISFKIPEMGEQSHNYTIPLCRLRHILTKSKVEQWRPTVNSLGFWHYRWKLNILHHNINPVGLWTNRHGASYITWLPNLFIAVRWIDYSFLASKSFTLTKNIELFPFASSEFSGFGKFEKSPFHF